MKFRNIFVRKENKENPVGVSLMPMGQRIVGGVKEGSALIKDGYERNVIVYRAVTKIASAAASIKFDLHEGDKILETHPIIDLLKRPNPANGEGSFIEELFTNFMITGEMWFVKNGLLSSEIPKELWALNPLDMKVVPGPSGLPMEYQHSKNQKITRFPVDQITGKSDVFFLKMYDPLNYWRGLPPLRAAALSADAHNEGLNWNYNLMRNGARPAGYVKGTGTAPGPEVIARIKEWYRNNIQGSSNAGEVLITYGGTEYVPFEQSARDMDYISGMKEYAKYVSSAFGVPLPLIDNDAASYNNMEQAKETLWTDTVIPLARRFLESFNPWLAFWYGPGLALTIDEDCILALEGLRQKKFDRTIKAKDGGLLTINEAREEIGFDKLDDPNADMVFVSAGTIPLNIADVGYHPSEAEVALSPSVDPNAPPAPPVPPGA